MLKAQVLNLPQPCREVWFDSCVNVESSSVEQNSVLYMDLLFPRPHSKKKKDLRNLGSWEKSYKKKAKYRFFTYKLKLRPALH
jgi:hypothetical protein